MFQLQILYNQMTGQDDYEQRGLKTWKEMVYCEGTINVTD
jgi:hypothetical protein